MRNQVRRNPPLRRRDGEEVPFAGLIQGLMPGADVGVSELGSSRGSDTHKLSASNPELKYAAAQRDNDGFLPVTLHIRFRRIRARSAVEVVAPRAAEGLVRFKGMRTARATPFRSAAMNSWMVSRRLDVIRNTESFRGSGNGAWRPIGTRRPAGIGYPEFGRRTKAA